MTVNRQTDKDLPANRDPRISPWYLLTARQLFLVASEVLRCLSLRSFLLVPNFRSASETFHFRASCFLAAHTITMQYETLLKRP